MPQLDTSTYISQIFWLFVCFLMLWSVSVGFILPKFQRILAERRTYIQEKEILAEQLKKEAQGLEKEVEAYLKSMRKDCHDEIMKTTQELNHSIEQRKSELSAHCKERLRLAEIRLLNRKSAVMDDVQDIAKAVTEDILTQLWGGPLTPEIAEQAVIQALAKRGSAS